MRITVVNQALRKPRLSNGISTRAKGMIWGPMAFAAVIIGTEAGWALATIPMGVGCILHTVVKWAYAKDHHMFAIMAKYANLADEYFPHMRERLPHPFQRPAKVGRGIRL